LLYLVLCGVNYYGNYNEVIDLIDNYTSYGIPALDKISEHYEWEAWKEKNKALAQS